MCNLIHLQREVITFLCPLYNIFGHMLALFIFIFFCVQNMTVMYTGESVAGNKLTVHTWQNTQDSSNFSCVITIRKDGTENVIFHSITNYGKRNSGLSAHVAKL